VVLEATTCVARVGVHAKVKLQRKTTSLNYKLAESSPKRQLVPPKSQKEKMVWRTNVKVEKEKKPAGHLEQHFWMMKSWFDNCTESSTALFQFLILSLQCKGNP
jgi:hypothetical protein